MDHFDSDCPHTASTIRCCVRGSWLIEWEKIRRDHVGNFYRKQLPDYLVNSIGATDTTSGWTTGGSAGSGGSTTGGWALRRAASRRNTTTTIATTSEACITLNAKILTSFPDSRAITNGITGYCRTIRKCQCKWIVVISIMTTKIAAACARPRYHVKTRENYGQKNYKNRCCFDEDHFVAAQMDEWWKTCDCKQREADL
jgi:hypothetical protein